jgi:GNAT superfamily N-acetyltransferase
MSSLQFSEIQQSSPDYAVAFALREDVLRKPLGLVLNEETLAQDRECFHLVCYLDGALVASLQLLPKGDGAIGMRQVAVVPRWQGQGIGRGLVEFAEQFARERGFTLMKLHARETAIRFYEKLGYECVGEPFVQVTLPHRAMQKKL